MSKEGLLEPGDLEEAANAALEESHSAASTATPGPAGALPRTTSCHSIVQYTAGRLVAGKRLSAGGPWSRQAPVLSHDVLWSAT